MAEITPGTLHITAPDQAPQTVILDLPVLRIGRLPDPENDLTLAHGLVSRRHAQIYCDREPYRIVDLGSSNGTTVNEIPLPEGEVRELHDGDEIAIGPFRLRYEAPRTPQPAPAEKAEDLFAGLRLEDAPAAPPPEPPVSEKAAPVTGAPRAWVGMSFDRSRWLQYLPYIYSEHPFLGRYLLLFEDLFGPMDQAIAHFYLYLDPRTAPESFLSVLAGWLGLVLDDRWPAERRRAILRSAVEMYDYRGTKKGMIQLLEASTGGRVTIEENSQGPHSFRVTITTGDEGLVDEAIVRYLIDTNKPAHTVYQLEIG
ncbi:MAG: FHA domain-containing protein [Anaerolineae bacterium]|nr:FHA domain-containing protein [Anaerolineae bacterium]